MLADFRFGDGHEQENAFCGRGDAGADDDAGWLQSAPLPGPLVYGKCGKDAHTESYPFAKQDRRAYGCKRNADGFLETSAQGDQRRN